MKTSWILLGTLIIAQVALCLGPGTNARAWRRSFLDRSVMGTAHYYDTLRVQRPALIHEECADGQEMRDGVVPCVGFVPFLFERLAFWVCPREGFDFTLVRGSSSPTRAPPTPA